MGGMFALPLVGLGPDWPVVWKSARTIAGLLLARSPSSDGETPSSAALAATASWALSPNFALSASCTLLRSEEHTSELQSLMRISYAGFCLNKKKILNVNMQITVLLHY